MISLQPQVGSNTVKVPETEFGDLVPVQGQKPDYTVRDPLGAISGFTDYSPQEMRAVAVWKEILAKTFQLYGFTPMDPRPVEYGMNLQTTGGITKQIYGVSRLQDGGLTKVGLPFDRTVPMALMVAKFANKMKFPYSRYDTGWSWRGEHATKGRYRAFIQADVDVIDKVLTARSDAICVASIIKGLESLGVPAPTVYLNHIGVAKAFMKSEGISPEKYNDALRAIDKLKPDNQEEVIQDLLKVEPNLTKEKAEGLLQKMSYRGDLEKFPIPEEFDKEANQALNHLREIEKIVTLMGVKGGMLVFAPNLTRGLDYYTGVVFESFIPGREKYGSVASGGRYDNLVGKFNGKVKLQGVGGSIGLTRLFDVMKAEKLVDLSKQTTAQVFVGYRSDKEFVTALAVAKGLMDQGIYTEFHTSERKVNQQLKLVNAKGIPFAVLVMDDDIILKDMALQKTTEGPTAQKVFESVDDLVKYLVAIKATGRLEATTQSATYYEPTEVKTEED